MLLRPITNGSFTGTQTLTIASTILGGVLITADGTNNTTVVVQRLDSSGKEIFEIVTKQPLWIAGPFSLEGTPTAYVSVSGTGSAAQIYEWVE
jgi:hypothetical protein